MSLNESYPQHVVTAVVVAHDGAAWLPHVADSLLNQTRPVQRVVAVDTGSRDRSGAVLASKFGQAAVFGMDRATGYGAAIARALSHRAANVPVPGSSGVPAADRIEWLWLLHDDCEPAPDALEQLLRGVAETSGAAVLGPKLRDWSNREVVLEAGVTLDTAARRVTGIEPREVDQGQHDGDRDALAVSSAGMLVRRDVWEQLGGFDTGMGLFMEDIDFCWRVHSAGYRVRVITDAVCYHVQAVVKRRRPLSVGRRARMLDRRNGLLTLLGNLPTRQMLTSAAGNFVVSFLRISFFLLAKRMSAALDETAAVAAVLGHPIRLFRARRRRSRGRRAAYSRIRADLPPGRSARRLAEFIASTMVKSAQVDTTGAHHASADPTEDDSLLVDNGLARRLLTSPSLLLLVALLTVSLIAGRSLIGGGPLGGGSLVPAWGGASDLWRTYLHAFHPDGIGSVAAAPPYLAVLAGLATLLGGKPWLAIDVLLLGCVPLSGMTAMLAVRKITNSALVRVWAAASYALLPVAMGVVAGARFGTAVAFIVLPLIAMLAGRVCTQTGRRAGRAAWATGLLVAIGAAFVPLLWLLAFVGCCAAVVLLRPTRAEAVRNLTIVAFTAPVLLLPWTLTLVSHPGWLLLEAGLPQPGTPATGLPARNLLLLSPGGPGLPPYWAAAGLVVAALASLLARRKRRLIIAGWAVAIAGLLAAVAVSHLTVAPSDGPPVTAWAGLPLALAAIGLLTAAVAGADALVSLVGRSPGEQVGTAGGSEGPASRAGTAGGSRGSSPRAGTARGYAGQVRRTGARSGARMWAGLLGLIACSAPLLAAASWLGAGVTGPVHPVSGPLVPEVVAASNDQGFQVRTLVLRSVRGQVSYLLLRGPSPSLADSELTPPAAARQALARAVADLVAPSGGQARNQSQVLADFDIGYVLLQAPVDQRLAGILNDVNGLQPYSNTSGVYLWQLVHLPARVTVVEPNGTVVPIPSGSVGVSGAVAPAAGGTLMLAEPTGGWSASVNGQALQPVPSPAGSWAQAFRLPAGGGTLAIGHSGFGHDVELALELLAFLALVGLALPGIHVAEAEGQRAASADRRRTPVAGPAGRATSGGVTDERDEVVSEADRRPAASAASVDRDEADQADSGSWRRVGPAGAPAGRAGRSARAVGRKRRASRPRVGRAKASGAGAGAGAGTADARDGGVDMDHSGRAGDGQAAGRRGGRGGGRVGLRRGQAAHGGAVAAGSAGAGPSADDPQPPAGRRPAPLPRRRGDAGTRLGRGPAGASPYAGADDRHDDQSSGWSQAPQARAWPYADNDDQSIGATGGSSLTGSAGRPYQQDGGALGGDRRAEASGRSHAARSPSGSPPPNTWSETPGRSADRPLYDTGYQTEGRGRSRDPYEVARYEVPDYRAGGYDRSRQHDLAGYEPADYPPGYDRGLADHGRAIHESADYPAGRDRGWGELARGRGGRDRGEARAGSRGRPADGDWDDEVNAPSQRRSPFERAGWRLGAGRGGRSSGRASAARHGADSRSQSMPQERLGRPGGDGSDVGFDDQPGGARMARPAGDARSGERDAPRRGRSDRWGRPSSGRPYDEPEWLDPTAGRMTSANHDWPASQERELDPLPPPQPRSAGRRRNVWRPDPGNVDDRYDRQEREGPSRDWGGLADAPEGDRNFGQRWPESEPDYEGDSW